MVEAFLGERGEWLIVWGVLGRGEGDQGSIALSEKVLMKHQSFCGEGPDDLLCGGCGWACGDQKSIAPKKSTFLVREISLLILWSKPILLGLNLKMIKLVKRNCSKVFKRTFSLIGPVTYTAGRSNNWLLLAEKYTFFYNFLSLLSDKRNMFSGDKTTLVCQANVFRTRKEVVRCQRPNEDLAQTSFPGKPAKISENLGEKNWERQVTWF